MVNGQILNGKGLLVKLHKRQLHGRPWIPANPTVHRNHPTCEKA
jgi:hypothetical protein